MRTAKIGPDLRLGSKTVSDSLTWNEVSLLPKIIKTEHFILQQAAAVNFDVTNIIPH